MVNTIENKNEELILYVASKLKDCPNFGSVMLNKALFYSDGLFYLKYGNAISSFKYVRQGQGPTPAPNQFMPLRTKMIDEGKVRMEEIPSIFGTTQKKLMPLQLPKKGVFNANELAVIDGVIKDCRKHTARELSDFSHKEIGWQLAEHMEEIPLFTILLTKAELDDEDYIWANDEIERLRPVPHN